MKKNNEKERWQCAWRPSNAYLQRVSERVDLQEEHISVNTSNKMAIRGYASKENHIMVFDKDW